MVQKIMQASRQNSVASAAQGLGKPLESAKGISPKQNFSRILSRAARAMAVGKKNGKPALSRKKEVKLPGATLVMNNLKKEQQALVLGKELSAKGKKSPLKINMKTEKYKRFKASSNESSQKSNSDTDYLEAVKSNENTPARSRKEADSFKIKQNRSTGKSVEVKTAVSGAIKIEIVDKRPGLPVKMDSVEKGRVEKLSPANRNRAGGGEKTLENGPKMPQQNVQETLFNSEQNNSPGSDFRMAETDIHISSRQTANPGNTVAELAQKLSGQEGSEIVRLVKVVLNDSNSGEVRINLRPENLGRIRVKILMQENRLTGQIFVESAMAREAMRDSLQSLQNRLADTGFSSANLELAWDNGSENYQQKEYEQNSSNQNLTIPFEQAEDLINRTMFDSSEQRVNIMV